VCIGFTQEMDVVNTKVYVHKVQVYHKVDHVDGLVSVSFHKNISYCV